MAFRLEKAEWGIVLHFFYFFYCLRLEQTLWTPKQSFLMEKGKNWKKMELRHFLEKAECGIGIIFFYFFDVIG